MTARQKEMPLLLVKIPNLLVNRLLLLEQIAMQKIIMIWLWDMERILWVIVALRSGNVQLPEIQVRYL